MVPFVDTDSDQAKYLVTGAAGFIGYHLSQKLLDLGFQVVGLDNLNDYYDVSLKKARLDQLIGHKQFRFVQMDICDKPVLMELFATHRPAVVINLAAQAGVRYSLENPDAYIQSNVVGFLNILEACHHYPIEHLVYASSSSVYGTNAKVPFEETDRVDNPVSLYAATKKSDELMAYTYSHLYGIPATGLRFFTVYGPWGRPDMAYFAFTKAFFQDKEIKVFNNGDFEHDLLRDFTYIDDIVGGIVRMMNKPPQDTVPHAIYNIGNNQPEKLMEFIATLEHCLSKSLGRSVELKKKFEPMKSGDVPATFASTDKLYEAVGFKPSTPLEVGLQRFTDWYVGFYSKHDHIMPN